MVEAIDQEAAMAPVGALVMNSTGNVVANPVFTGIDKASAMTASGYVFINKRKPKDALASATKQVPIIFMVA